MRVEIFDALPATSLNVWVWMSGGLSPTSGGPPDGCAGMSSSKPLVGTIRPLISATPVTTVLPGRGMGTVATYTALAPVGSLALVLLSYCGLTFIDSNRAT